MLTKVSSFSVFKQNHGPKKQGAFYQLNLAKNNGPFLSKDIMHDNRQSMTLLTNKQILKSHEIMGNTISNLSKGKKQSIISQQKVENFISVINYCMKQLEQFSAVSGIMRLEEKSLHMAMQEVNRRTCQGIASLYESSMPIIKQFFKKVKESNNNDKSQNYQIKKELEMIGYNDDLLRKGLTECESKIERLQQIFQSQIHEQISKLP